MLYLEQWVLNGVCSRNAGSVFF